MMSDTGARGTNKTVYIYIARLLEPSGRGHSKANEISTVLHVFISSRAGICTVDRHFNPIEAATFFTADSGLLLH